MDHFSLFKLIIDVVIVVLVHDENGDCMFCWFVFVEVAVCDGCVVLSWILIRAIDIVCVGLLAVVLRHLHVCICFVFNIWHCRTNESTL